MSGVNLQVNPEALQPLIEAAVQAALLRLEELRGQTDGRVAYSEAEGAALIGVETHVLRDARRRREIVGYQIAGGRIRYRREDLIAYVMRQPWTPETARTSGWPAGRRRGGRGASANGAPR